MSGGLDGGVVLFVGRRGSGKTHRIREYVVRLVARRRTVVCFDVSGDIYGRKAGEGLHAEYARRQSPSEMIRQYRTVEEYERHMRATERVAFGRLSPPLPRVACISPDDPKHLRAEGARFRELMGRYHKRGWAWVCDEAELVFTDYGAKSDAFPLVVLSRNFSSLLVVACKDPIRVSVDIRRGADAVFVFALNTREAVLSLRDVVDPEIAVRVTRFPKRRFLYVSPATDHAGRSNPELLDADDPLPVDL